MDWEHVKTLVEVVNALRGYPTLKPLHDEAFAELEDLVRQEPVKPPVKKYEAAK